MDDTHKLIIVVSGAAIATGWAGLRILDYFIEMEYDKAIYKPNRPRASPNWRVIQIADWFTHPFAAIMWAGILMLVGAILTPP